MSKPNRILVADDREVARQSLAAWLREDGHDVTMAASGTEVVELVRQNEFDICFLDLKMPPGPDGLETMAEIRSLRPDIAVVIITAFASVDTAVQAMKQGAEDYVVKPFDLSQVSLLVERILRRRELQRENVYLRKTLSGRYHFQDLVSKNRRMHEIFRLIEDVADLRSTVLLQGESGVGKELVARALHFSGERAARPFVAVSCTALSESLLESELFGYERGAFTGAANRRQGKFELADGGTIFLDEIGEISPKLQMDLLRVLEGRNFFRVGGTEEVKVDVRFIAATNRDLQAAVQAGDFREDLYYRLNVINIALPPLRERVEDIPLLAEHFREQLAAELGKPIKGISEGALRVLLHREWPGNIRQLRNCIERAMVTSRGEAITEEYLSFLAQEERRMESWGPPDSLPLSEVEKKVIEAVMRRTAGNVREAAAILGIDRSTLYDKIKRYGVGK